MSAQDERTVRNSRRQMKRMIVIGAIVSVIGIAIGLLIPWFPIQGSHQAKHIDTVWHVLIIASVPMFILVEVVVVYCVITFRVRPGEELMDGPPIHGNTKLEILWTAFPAVLLIALCSYAYVILTKVESSEANALPIRVVAEQFTFTFYYRDANGKEFASPQLYLPTNQAVKFAVQSKDVIHDFAVPAFRVKIDAVPGITTRLNVKTTNQLGTYDVVCNELCGIGHAVMRQTAHIVSPSAFQQWLARQNKTSAPNTASSRTGAPDGKTIFTQGAQPPCASCHTLKAAGANQTIGPDLGKVLKGKGKAFIRQRLLNPRTANVPGYQPTIMPDNYGQTLKPAEIDAVVNYLAQVTR